MQMEYIFHKKPAAMLEAITETVRLCAAKTADVELIAEDAARADEPFLYSVLAAAIEAGATTVTVCDAAGNLLPDEFRAFLRRIKENVPALEGVTLGAACADTLSMADACLIAAVDAGARELKAAAHGGNTASLQNVARLLAERGESFGIFTNVRTVELRRITQQIESIFRGEKGKAAPEQAKENAAALVLTRHDDKEAVLKAAAAIGYELSEEDGEAVWNAFCEIAQRREQIDARELDAIVAAAAMQVPPTYILKSYVITSGNLTRAMATVVLVRDEMEFEGTGVGDGPVDASFKALETAVNAHYELDEFQIRAVTEGREAMGETVVRLTHNGKLYGGRGISTDIVGASIGAYVSALNKIAYEEEQTV
jgi:2-isopropylmalate synthase